MGTGVSAATWHAAIHLVLHAAIPAVVARVRDRAAWLRNAALMLAGNLIDLDHLVADVVYDPGRCSIGFHPLHSSLAMAAYGLLLLPARTRFLGIGLFIHLAVDALDCGGMALMWW